MKPVASVRCAAALALLAVAALLPSGAGVAAPDAALSFTPCRLEHRSRLRAFAAECTRIAVPENRADPKSRRIELFVARIPSISRDGPRDPLFLIAGGPGMGTAEMYPGVAEAFARVNRHRDLVLVDQRGTGHSERLGCALRDETLVDADPAQIRAITMRCLDALRTQHDLRQYTTSVAVADLDAVRAALGYETINLYGVSYGTRVAQHYLRRHPQRVRSLILDGVVPPGLALGPAIATDAEAALSRILARCVSDAACYGAFGDPAVHYRALRASLERAPVEIMLPDPKTAAPRTLRFGVGHLAAVLRLQSYASASAALLPYALATAAREGNYRPLGGLYLMIDAQSGDLIAYGMHNSVVCTEDLPFVDPARIDRARLDATYLGVSPLDGLTAICSVWPRGVLDPDLRAPLRATAPVLLLSGEADPVTPPSNAVRAMEGLARARHITVRAAGHGQVALPCIDALFDQFLRAANPAELDARCLLKARPEPFFTNALGPAP